MTQSETLYFEAQAVIAGGVNSPVRNFSNVNHHPLFIESASGPYITTVDGTTYIDYVGSWGPMIVGHAHPTVIEATTKQMKKGLSFGAPTDLETQLAKKIERFYPSIEKIRMVNSGTEATMSAIRLARGFTKRDKIVKFVGCYHGHADMLLVAAGSGALTFGTPSSAGVPQAATQQTLLAQFNDLESVTNWFKKFPEEIACIIIEPVAGNMNFVPGLPSFIEGLRNLCDEYGSLLIFDEVMCGFRVAEGGAQEYYGIQADLTTLGKVIGGGMPVGAFGGRAEIMDYLAPNGPVYQAGTLSGNPISMRAGLTTLELLETPNFFEDMHQKTKQLTDGIQAMADQFDISFTTNQIGSMFGCFFSSEETVTNYDQAINIDKKQFTHFFHQMLKHGIYLAPSPFEAGFMSSAHTSETIEKTINAAKMSFASLKNTVLENAE